VPRNGSGTYTRVNTFNSGASITAAGHNQNWADMETEITNSVAADGQTTITGALKGAAGTVAAPSYSFSTDPDSGVYRIGANNVGIAAGGSKIVDVTTTGATVVGTFSATSVQQEGVQIVPPGVVVPYAGSSAPTGWLLCNGQLASRTTYANLFTAIGDTYGAGDGSTTFALPDCTGRAIFGKEASATRLTSGVSGIDGATLGSAASTQSFTISQTHLPNISLTTSITDPGHTHPIPNVTASASGAGSAGSFSQGVGGSPQSASTYFASANVTGNTTGITASTALGGSGTALSRVPPGIVLNYIIKT
jgi:microcystin-dependent protein